MSKKFIITEEEMQKIALLIVSSSQVIKQASAIGKNLLEDNEKLASELDEIKEKERKVQRQTAIDKIAGILQGKGFVSKTAMPGKVAELEKMSDETLFQLENTFDGLNGTPAEKQAAVEGFTTLEFLQPFSVDEKTYDGRPGPMKF